MSDIKNIIIECLMQEDIKGDKFHEDIGGDYEKMKQAFVSASRDADELIKKLIAVIPLGNHVADGKNRTKEDAKSKGKHLSDMNKLLTNSVNNFFNGINDFRKEYKNYL